MNTTVPINLPDGWMPYMVTYLGIVMVVGIFGNILTIVALPYVRIRYGQEFSILQTNSVILLLHLSFCDLLWCIIGFPHFIQVYIVGFFLYSSDSCWWLGMVRNLVAYADFSSLAVISVCVCSHRLCKTCRTEGVTTSHQDHDRVFGGNRIFLICFFIWVASFLYMVPNIFGITGSFGWSGNLFGCNLTPSRNTLLDQLNHHLGVMVNLVIIVVCYGLVACQLCKDLKKGRKELNPAIQDAVNALTKKYLATLFILSLSYLILIVPAAFASGFAGSDKDSISLDGDHQDHGDTELSFWPGPKFEALLTMWYFCVYSINFMIYILTNKRLRDAYLRFLRDAIQWVAKFSGSSSSPTDPEQPSRSSRPWFHITISNTGPDGPTGHSISPGSDLDEYNNSDTHDTTF